MFLITLILLSGFGLIVGSFLNVVVYRMRTGMSAVKGRSKCFSCGKTLEIADLIPIFSFLFLKGRCRRCKAKISIQYPIVECAGLLSFLLPYLVLQPFQPIEYVQYIISVVFFLVLIVMSAYDIRHKIIPNSISVTLGILGILSVICRLQAIFIIPTSDLYAGILLPFIFFLLWVITKGKGIGLGDAKISVGLGLFLGISSGISMVMIAFWIGAIVSLLTIGFQKIFHKKGLTFKSEVPFGPYLAISTFIVFLFNIDFGTLSMWLSF
jgi:leader peptidase (prepilin peptidase) / N-methyltransferase